MAAIGNNAGLDDVEGRHQSLIAGSRDFVPG
jgi:hypothetical protein